MGHPTEFNTITVDYTYLLPPLTMRASKYHLNTLKEAPAEAEIASHQLMTRAGMIRKLAGGIYTSCRWG